jgi:hypothetical protein
MQVIKQYLPASSGVTTLCEAAVSILPSLTELDRKKKDMMGSVPPDEKLVL